MELNRARLRGRAGGVPLPALTERQLTMIYATHQADAYETPAELDAAIIDRAPGFIRASWFGGAIQHVTAHMVSDLKMSGRFQVTDIDVERGRVSIEDNATGLEYNIAANGYVS